MIYNTTVKIAEDSERFETRDFNIVLTKGSTFIWNIRVEVPTTGEGWNATDVPSGVHARMHWRTTLESPTTVLEADSDGGDYITIDDSDPTDIRVTVEIPASVTTALVFPTNNTTLGTSQSYRRGGRGVYDFEMVLPAPLSRVFRIYEGDVIASDEVTR